MAETLLSNMHHQMPFVVEEGRDRDWMKGLGHDKVRLVVVALIVACAAAAAATAEELKRIEDQQTLALKLSNLVA